MFKVIRWVVTGILAIGIPLWVYLAFFAREPVFSVEDDVALGEQTVRALEEDPEEYPILSPEDYTEAYGHLTRIVGQVVASDDIQYADIFAYDTVRIIHRDDVLNAFVTPGGFIYVYSGLIRYLDTEDHLAGVLGHEIAHAERRHGSLRLQKEYGTKNLLRFALWNPSVGAGEVIFGKILTDLTSLDYGRSQEAESDRLSVQYLADTNYACDGAAGFFEKLLAEDSAANIPEFLSSHPASDSRVADIRREAETVGCSTEPVVQSQWGDFQESLPSVNQPGEVEPVETTPSTTE